MSEKLSLTVFTNFVNLDNELLISTTQRIEQ